MEDVWNEDDQATAENNRIQRDWKRMRETYMVDGFRESLDKTRESFLQFGFDDGFLDSFPTSIHPQRIIASFNALTLWMKKKGEQEISEDFKKQLEKTENELLQAQTQFTKTIKTNQQQLTTPFQKNQHFEAYLDVLITILSEFMIFALSFTSKSKRETVILWKLIELITSVSGELSQLQTIIWTNLSELLSLLGNEKSQNLIRQEILKLFSIIISKFNPKETFTFFLESITTSKSIIVINQLNQYFPKILERIEKKKSGFLEEWMNVIVKNPLFFQERLSILNKQQQTQQQENEDEEEKPKEKIPTKIEIAEGFEESEFSTIDSKKENEIVSQIISPLFSDFLKPLVSNLIAEINSEKSIDSSSTTFSANFYLKSFFKGTQDQIKRKKLLSSFTLVLLEKISFLPSSLTTNSIVFDLISILGQCDFDFSNYLMNSFHSSHPLFPSSEVSEPDFLEDVLSPETLPFTKAFILLSSIQFNQNQIQTANSNSIYFVPTVLSLVSLAELRIGAACLLLTNPSHYQKAFELVESISKLLPKNQQTFEIFSDSNQLKSTLEERGWVEFCHRLIDFLVRCPLKEVRLRGYSILKLIFSVLSDSPRFALLENVILRCPYSSVTAQLLYLLKELIDKEWNHQNFHSKFLSAEVSSFLEQFHFSKTSSTTQSESLFMRMDILTQLISLYRFLIARDQQSSKNSKSSHRFLSKKQLQQLESNFVKPLSNQIEIEIRKCNTKPTKEFVKQQQEILNANNIPAKKTTKEDVKQSEEMALTSVLLLNDSLKPLSQVLTQQLNQK